MSKKTSMLFIAILSLILLTACGKQSGESQGTESNSGGVDSILEGYVIKNEKEDAVELGEISKMLNPQEVYSKLTYTPEMFYGKYQLLGPQEVKEELYAKSSYFKWTEYNRNLEYTILPSCIEAGKHTFNHIITNIEGDWMSVRFVYYKDNEYFENDILCSYTIDGNKLILNLLESFEIDKESHTITSYKFSDTTLEYTFAFSGRNLTLSADGNSVTLTTGVDAYGKEDYFNVEHCVSAGSKSIGGIDVIDFCYSLDYPPSLYFDMENGKSSRNSIAVLQENGLFTFTLSFMKRLETYQFVYFYGGSDGIVLTDGTNTYYYNDTLLDRKKNSLKSYLTEEQTSKIDALDKKQLELIVEKKENLIQDLVKAFNNAGIKVTVDEKTGEIAMDATVLFGGDSAALTDEGKAFLNKFVDAYASIVFSDKYDGFVSKTMVEGHIAPVAGGTYESGLPLSEERANNVKDYCLSSETGVDTSKLDSNFEAVGYSNTKPIQDKDGNVDMAASRRVSFRFIINLDQRN